MTTIPTALPTGEWVLDPTRTTASFAVRNGPGTVHGTVPVTAGAVRVDGAGVRVEAELDLSALDTGNPRRDRDLGKPGLLDLDRHPRLRFVADDVRGTDGGWVLVGTLSVRGREVPVTLTVADADRPDLLDAGDATAVGTTRLDRRDLGVRAPRVLIGRWIEVTVRAVLVREPG
ncbi:YceI family protein [Pseudonocardia humida]|uniref:YceI family protein n=1 Tax=Pseudonocardia humida TaxID=2800819 RepID=A0ABT1ACU1_9PSEU|nr:YceI family protein [Pseudonocardia humida]MCO1660569.1 YceI family protein [Pseudonocardia humida]